VHAGSLFEGSDVLGVGRQPTQGRSSRSEIEFETKERRGGGNMPSSELGTDEEIVNSKVRVPEHVVQRAFPAETVVLNLNTGQYHGFNPTAGRILEVLEGSDNVGEAVEQLAGEYGQPKEVIEQDARELCTDLLDRGLIELDADS
jgi:coenzyme PQQ synthesis protein D (PqqD)